VLEGIKSDIETPGSFAIKYGILTSSPVTRIKFMLQNLPKTILETKSAPRARGALEVIEEAGGVGRLEEIKPEEAPKIDIAEEEPTIATVPDKSCLKCGFPIKKDDEYCQFCHSPLVEKKTPNIKTMINAGKSGNILTPKKLLIYIAAAVVILLLGLLTR
jgi:RNA polymerase subunit RPABC4/transcription elongation factor Spt4